MSLRLCAALAFLLIAPSMAVGQGFNSYSGRNHPELDWQVAHTPHFEIMYPARLAGIEAEAAAIAETTYDALSENLEVTFDRPIRIYLSDEDGIANGFAVPVGNGYTAIWVRVDDAAWSWSGPEKWMRTVIAHELAHIFHYRATQSPLGLAGRMLSNPLPRFWTEGLAQYETERWHAYRGERWLRTAVLGDDLSYKDGRSAWNGRLLYAVGNAQLRRFAEQYGDSTLVDLLQHRRPALLGLTKVHDFYDAFEAVTGETYRSFYDDWRRHVNVYYNTLASGLETSDSLGTDPLALGGQYIYDVRFSPDTTRIAYVGMPSLSRPVRRLYVRTRTSGETDVIAEGAIEAPLAWHPASEQIAFVRRARGPHGSLLDDLFLADLEAGDTHRLTRGRRASAPAWHPDGRRLAYAASRGETTNVFLLDPATGEEEQVTHLSGDVQITHLAWHPSGDSLAAARFAADGTRDVVSIQMDGTVRSLTPGSFDNRLPVWSPDGSELAFTSLRDGVPNIFAYDPATGSERRITYLATGASARDWVRADTTLLPADSTVDASAGSTHGSALVAIVGMSKTRSAAYPLRPDRQPPLTAPEVPEAYTSWTQQTPPVQLPTHIAPDPSLVERRSEYCSVCNITHALTFGVPYVAEGDAGLAGLSTWIEPLGKHVLSGIGSISFLDPIDATYGALTYLNNQFAPSLQLSIYRLPGSLRFYGDDVLVEEIAGGDLTARWPLDLFSRPYAGAALQARLRWAHFDPIETSDSAPAPPAEAQQSDLRLTFLWKTQRPYRYNTVHPLDGRGLRFSLLGAAPIAGGDTRFLQGDLATYAVLPGLGTQRLFAYGRAAAQTGEVLPQNVLGLSRYDDPRVALPGQLPFAFGEAERVRGYRSFAFGNRLLFGSVEYRMPFIDLNTQVLGLVRLGPSSLALFADGALVWSDAAFDTAERRLGVGLEIKNAVQLFGALTLTHAAGLAQPAETVGDMDRLNWYYRIRTPLPF